MTKERKNRNMLPNGRNRTGRFVKIDHSLLSSEAYRALSPNARSLLIELAALENGKNNGSLYLSVRDAAARMGVADTTAASRAFDELQELGFIVLTKDAHFHVKVSEHSRARCFRLTWLPVPGQRKAPSLEFLDRKPPPDARAYKRMQAGCAAWKRYRKALTSGRMPVLDTNTLDASAALMEQKAVSDFYTRKCRGAGFLPFLIVRHSYTHTSAISLRAANDL